MPSRSRVLGAVAAGGVLGAEARYLLGAAFPAAPGSWPWTTFWINITGCLLIGVLTTVLTELLARPHPLLRALLGVGVLGGYTTFSTWSVETVQLVEHGSYGAALGYALVSPVAAILACAFAVAATRRIGRPV
ncbi:fluoride efflux transporter CrcB [Pseudonocardia parietis]|uniref:Fluoride-specific ion channel FluC n=1 Tax=Pseudonocardia parietis TaxID=570936 RepID=A0ABS4W4P2_9PSEU|nr:fluoride efflux transporter CrcB [Pseudonocardia parietis]MBP2371192.1 CrcB protein [Pseudonocardia parietis]